MNAPLPAAFRSVTSGDFSAGPPWQSPGPIHPRRPCERIGDDAGAVTVRYEDRSFSCCFLAADGARLSFETCLSNGAIVLVSVHVADGWARFAEVHGPKLDQKSCAELREETERRLVDARIWPEAERRDLVAGPWPKSE